MRVFSVILFGLLVWLQADLWFGKNGISELRQVQDEIAVQSSVNAELQKRNDEMFAR